ncbi:cobalt-zinc-cadmium resistance protein CzcA [Vibrio astriarenae]|nr:cobalt-zinc-cadmium resistance protein CzcA [Vibrio sp. C7]
MLDSDHSYAFTLITAITWQGEQNPNLLVMNRYAKELAQQFRAMSGTEFVDEYGTVTEEILVSIDEGQLLPSGGVHKAYHKLLAVQTQKTRQVSW